MLEETWTFEPPVPEQFGVKRDHHNRFELLSENSLNLATPRIQKMCRMPIGQPFCDCRIVKRLFTFARGNSIIFYAGKFSLPARNSSEVLKRKIETCVPVEFTIMRIAGVTDLSAPNLSA